MLYRLCLDFQGCFEEIPAFAGAKVSEGHFRLSAGMTDCAGVQLFGGRHKDKVKISNRKNIKAEDRVL